MITRFSPWEIAGDPVEQKKTSRRRRKEVNRPFEFFNGPLEGGTLYAVFLRAYVKEVRLHQQLSSLFII